MCAISMTRVADESTIKVSAKNNNKDESKEKSLQFLETKNLLSLFLTKLIKRIKQMMIISS